MNALKRQIEFINELDKLKSVYRQTMVKSENSRQENSAEHSWHITLMATLLSRLCIRAGQYSSGCFHAADSRHCGD